MNIQSSIVINEDFARDLEWYERWGHDQTDTQCDLQFSAADDEEAPPPLITSQRRHDVHLNTDLIGVTLIAGDFRKHSYSFMNITHCNLSFGQFRQANLMSSLISCSDLSGANLECANLEHSEIEHCSFAHADLTHVNLQGSHLESVDFTGADLRGADLTDCAVLRCVFTNALVDRRTRLPFPDSISRRLGLRPYQPLMASSING